MKKSWIDISMPIRPGMMNWPGDPEVSIWRDVDMSHGGDCNASSLSMSVHTGTHLDAPLHYIQDGKSIDEMPLETMMGPACVVEILHPEMITTKELQSLNLSSETRILFKTRNSANHLLEGDFQEKYVHVTPEAACYLSHQQVQLIGIDALSVGACDQSGVSTHQELLGKGIWVLEGLDLSHVNPGRYELACMPLRILRSDGAPARALLYGPG